jgi:hypothetical protein
MQSEKSRDHYDNDHYADDVEYIHCFAPIEATPANSSTTPVFFSSESFSVVAHS